MMLPTLYEYQRTSQFVSNLCGLNLTPSPMDGTDGYRRLEWAWTQNVDTRVAPVIRRREKRILIGELIKPLGMCALDRLAFVDGKKFYYNGYFYGSAAGDTVGNMDDTTVKTMVPMGSEIVIFPDRKIFSTASCTWRDMDVVNETDGTSTVTVTLARADGTPYEDYTVSDTAPENPEHGDLWLDTSEYTAVMKVWSAYTNMWVDEYTTCVSVYCEDSDIGVGLNVDDVVEVSGLADETLNGTWQLLYVDDDTIVFNGVISAQQTQTAKVTIKRQAPEMDFVIEHNNRLWGCNSSKHEIYASALGDPTNWRKYLGLSTDSYAVTVGSPGDFTGMAVVNSSVCAFKENVIHKIYGTMPSNFQLTTDHYRGVQAGSGKSLVRVNELVYYKSVFDFCAYDGTEVAGISTALGLGPWTDAVSGANDRRVYVSMKDGAGKWQLLTYDTETGYWMREDETQVLYFASCLTETFFLTKEANGHGKLWAVRTAEYAKNKFLNGNDYTVITSETPFVAREETDAEVPWILRTGELLSMAANNKHVGRVQLLVELDTNTQLTVRIKKDNEAWETIEYYLNRNKRRYTLPIWPRRCDRFVIELSGTGDCKVYNLSWLVEAGSEYGRE